MMLYLFVKDENGNCIRLSNDCDVPAQLTSIVEDFTARGYSLAEAAEYDEQVIRGAMKVASPDAHSTPVNELPVEPEASVVA